MAGIDDNDAIIGDWVPPSPSPRALFSAMLGEDISSKKSNNDFFGVNDGEGLFLGSAFGNTNEKNDATQGGNQLTRLGSFNEQTSSSRGGLVERMAARAGFNAPRLDTEIISRSADLTLTSNYTRSPYLTIPAGLSPTTLLESPVFLLNSLAQPSPTTGKFSFLPCSNGRSSATIREAPVRCKDNFFENIESFAFQTLAESGPSFFLGATKITPPTFPPQSFPNIDVSVQSKNSHQSRNVEPARANSRPSTEKENGINTISPERRVCDVVGGNAEHSPPLNEPQVGEERDQRVSGDSTGNGGGGVGTPAEDGYNWRKYGQKQVKGSECPRSYYKCMHPNCPVKKKVERSHEGHITEIIYTGGHNHPKPPPNRRTSLGSSNNTLLDTQFDANEQTDPQSDADGDSLWASAQKAGTTDFKNENVEVTSAALPTQNGNSFESGEAVDVSSMFSNEEDEDDRATQSSVGNDGEGDESESKRRKIEAYATEISGASRAIREPRVVVQTTSEVDILEDGYRWRKYGQKVVKGNPNPRSYYKCTNASCNVRKHVERASHDLKSVITTYEGKHNHDVPAARNSTHHVNSGPSSNNNVTAQTGAATVQNHVHRPEPSQVYNGMARFERPPLFGSYALPGRQQQQMVGPTPGFSFGMNQPGFTNMAMAGFGPGGLPKFPMLPAHHPYLAQQHHQQGNGMGFVMPKGEPKVEPMSEPALNLPNSTSVYQQLMRGSLLGPQM